MLEAADVPDTAPPAGILHFGAVSAVDGEGRSVQPLLPYTVTIWHGRTELGRVMPKTLALYEWDGATWKREPSSRVHLAGKSVVATPDHNEGAEGVCPCAVVAAGAGSAASPARLRGAPGSGSTGAEDSVTASVTRCAFGRARRSRSA